MGFNYQKTARVAAQAIRKFGQPCILTSRVNGAYDQETLAPTLTTSTQTINAAVFDYSVKDINGTHVKHGDKKLLISPLTAVGAVLVPPDVDDTITIGAIVYSIKSVKDVNPAGVVCMYECNVRR